MEKRKKAKKSIWSDDLSLDSETERERELLEAKEFEELERQGCVEYLPEELDTLVGFVQKMTTLPGLREDDWTDDCIDTIRHFILHPNSRVLMVYFENHKLKATLEVPSSPVMSLNYFVRDDEIRFTADNFHDEIVFGSIAESAHSSLLRTMEMVFAPLIIASKSWPDIKDEICLQLHRLLAKLTGICYSKLGLTILYTPQEARDLSVTEVMVRRGLLTRLEEVFVHWIQQMTTTLRDHDRLEAQKDAVPMQEYELWIQKCENLINLQKQLNSPNIQHIIKIMRESNSAYMNMFNNLLIKLKASIREAKSNVTYLQVIEQTCQAMDAERNLSELVKYFSQIMNTFRFIWIESPCYNSELRVTNLFTYLSHQVIKKCTSIVDLTSMFAGNTRRAMEELRMCIDCCETYKEVYDLVSDAHNEREPGTWNLDKMKIFNELEAFIQRCIDLLDMCNCMIVFGRIDSWENIPRCQFGGAQGYEFELFCIQNEKMFFEAVYKVHKIQSSIFVLNDSTWHAAFAEFQKFIVQLERRVSDMITKVFLPINNVEEGIQTICSLFNFSKRNYMQNILEQKLREIWSMFRGTIELTQMHSVAHRDRHFGDLPEYCGKALDNITRRHRLSYQKKIMNPAGYILPCRHISRIMDEYKHAVGVIEPAINDVYSMWKSSTQNISEKALIEGNVMRESDGKMQLLECNANRDYLLLEREMFHWRNIGWEIPDNVAAVLSKLPNFRQLYERAILIARKYNTLLQSMSNDERQLFEPLINICKAKIEPGINKLRWKSRHLGQFLEKCLESVNDVQELLDVYKVCTSNISRLNRMMGQTLLIEFALYDAVEFDDLKKSLEGMGAAATRKLEALCKEMAAFIAIIHQGLEPIVKQMTFKLIFVKKNNQQLEKSLKKVIRSSMENMYATVRGNASVGPLPLLKMKAILDERNVAFVPSREDVLFFFSNILNTLVHLVKNIPRLDEIFMLPEQKMRNLYNAIENDYESRRLQELVTQETLIALKMVNDETKLWEEYQHIWKLSKEEHLQEFVESNPSAEGFENKMIHYKDLSMIINAQNNIMQVNFLLIYFQELKKAIIAHCTEWENMFLHCLERLTNEDIDGVYTYVKENIETLLFEPKSLIDLSASFDNYKRIYSDIKDTEKLFEVIREELEVIERYGVEGADDMRKKADDIKPLWRDYLLQLEKAKKHLEESKELIKNSKLEQAQIFKDEAQAFLESFLRNLPTQASLQAKDAMLIIDGVKSQVAERRERERLIKADMYFFNISLPPSAELAKVEKELDDLDQVWHVVQQWEDAWETYRLSSFWTLETEEVEETMQSLYSELGLLSRRLKARHWEIIDYTLDKVNKFCKTIPILNEIKNKSIQKRHWDIIRKIMNSDFDENSASFKLEAIIALNFQKYAEEITEVSKTATMEGNIERGLKEITQVWSSTMFGMVAYRDGIYKIQNVDDCSQFLEDHIVQLSVMKSTKYVAPFLEDVEYWEKTLGAVSDCIEAALQVQRRWFYLENIFMGEDIKKQLPEESNKFNGITMQWRAITKRMSQATNAISACLYKPAPSLYDELNEMLDDLEKIQRSLEKYLEVKRQLFPRFYFISNDEMLEILGNSKKPHLVQIHMKKLFDNLNKMNLKKNLSGVPIATGMISEDGEAIEWKQSVTLNTPSEIWLKELEKNMQSSLKEVLIRTLNALKKAGLQREDWIDEWPGQLGITCSKIQWTSDCIKFLNQCKVVQNKKPLKKLRHRANVILQILLRMSRKELPKILRLKVNALAVIEIHSRDVVDRLYRNNCIDVNTFEWFSQLKFFFNKERKECMVRQTNTCSWYSYEYIGNSGRLVITPLTDRCYITLTTALSLFKGGSPQGPAGTGKTETVKDLGRALARWVVVTNCSDGLDYKSMAKCFSGIAQSGCWGCFDEFNRINIEVLSVVAQQILSVLTALSAGAKQFMFEGYDIKLVDTCGIFITMNPGYAGRTELPDNLKSMFRPISMSVPDNLIIAENTLFSDGFENYKVNAKKVVTLYELAKNQLSKQDHYDFGLRSMVALLRYAGAKRRNHPNIPEEEIVILAMKDMNFPRLTAKDAPLFEGIIKDIFPASGRPAMNYEMLNKAVTEEMKIAGLQAFPVALMKVIQVMETKNSRHSTMVLGDTNTAKSVTWQMLANTLTRLSKESQPGFESVRYYPINPKALDLAELYGEYNISTGEWMDGIISSIMRTICQEETPVLKWIVFDGPVDAVWIENLNSVMDDNKLLTLVNSERISMPPMVSLLFEALDLSVASPATVSRCGMVYNDYKDWGWWPFVNSWLLTIPDEEYRQNLLELFRKYLGATLQFKRTHLKEGDGVQGQELTGVRCLCRLLKVLAPKSPEQEDPSLKETKDISNTINKMIFLFCMVWSVCATLDGDSRKKMDTWLREKEAVFPLNRTIYDYFVDAKRRQFILWDEKLPEMWNFNLELGFHSIIVPTVESVRVQHLSGLLLKAGHGVLLGGSSGTGKTCVVQSILKNLEQSVFSDVTINMSARTTSNNVQDMIEARLEKITKGVYRPSGGRTMVCFVDDLNMPARDEYGSQPPLEFLRQFLDYGYWYDRRRQTKKYIKNMVMVGAAGPPGGSRSPLPRRLLSAFHAFFLPPPSHGQLTSIFGTMVAQHFVDFDEVTKNVGKLTLNATIEIFNNVVAKLLPTPEKMHYLFNLRDISRIFQGLLRSNKDCQDTKQSLLRLWVHENFRVFYDRLTNKTDRDWFVEMLNATLGSHFETTFHSLCPEKDSPIFGDFMNKNRMYEDISNVEELRVFMESKLEEYNSSPGVVKMRLVLFRYALEHVARIVRVISQPRGNMLLVGIGGSGRQSLCRLASFICDYARFQIAPSKSYGMKELYEDLKSLYKSCGVYNKPTSFIFCDFHIVHEGFTEIINNLLSSGEVTNLFKPDEFEDIKNALEKAMKKANVIQTNESTKFFLIDRVRENLHLNICMSPIGDDFRSRLRQYPALINCTTIDWFLEWPKEALLAVAYTFLGGVKLIDSITGDHHLKPTDVMVADELQSSIASVMSLIHTSVSQYSKKMLTELKRTNYVTPSNYLQLFYGFKEMLDKKRLDIASSANKLRNGLCKLEETRESVEIMSKEIIVAKEKVEVYTKECLEYMSTINKQKQVADEQQKTVVARSAKTAEEEGKCKVLAAAAMQDLQKAMPALDAAVAALDSLNKKDISEIKSYASPPVKVEMVLQAVMTLLQVDTSWSEIKKQMGNTNFLEILRNFDKDHIPRSVLKRINGFTSRPDFDPAIVGTISTAAKSLCLWVRAIEKYGEVYKVVKPKKDRLDEAEASLKILQDNLAQDQRNLEELQEQLENLQTEYKNKMAQKDELTKKAAMLEAKLERAAALVDGLEGERERWLVSVANYDTHFGNLVGDCLMATAFISYMGPFPSEYREQLVKDWSKEIIQNNIPFSENFTVQSFLIVDDSILTEWIKWGLPDDPFSTENGIIMTNARKWPLAVDPQGQALIWICNMEKINNIQVVDFGQPDYLKILESCLTLGKPILIKNIEEVLDPSVTPILNKDIVTIGTRVMIKFNNKVIDYHSDFRLFLTTKLGNPTYTPEILIQTKMINFAVKERGLQSQLLSVLVRKEVPQLEQMKETLVTNISKNKKILVDLENELLRLMNESQGSLLDNEELFSTLQISKKTSAEVKEALETSQETEKEIDHARQGYIPTARRASVLFFVLNDLSKIDSMYQFSLDTYIDMFTYSIKKSDKSPVLADRIHNLNEFHTHFVYTNTCRSLFEKHKLVFAFHLTVKILAEKGALELQEYQFLLQGGIVLDRSKQPENPTDWMPESCWDSVTQLGEIPGFHGVHETFEAHNREWEAWYLHPEPETLPLLGEWNKICSKFQRLLFIRALRLDRLTTGLSTFISNTLGARYVEPPVLNIKAAWQESTSKTPLLFILSPGVDPTSSLLELASDCKMDTQFQSLSLGQGQSARAIALLEEAKQTGGWVFLANCHLACKWLGTVRDLDDPKVHKQFRLWLSSMPDPAFPLDLLQRSIKMTTEPPQGLKGNMLRLFAGINEERFESSSPMFRKLLFSVSFYHCTLVARKRFRELGYNVVYSFNNSDFEASENLLSVYLEEFETVPWETLKYLFSIIIYGGQISDVWDMRVLGAHIDQIFCEEVLEEHSFQLSPVSAYRVPVDGSLRSYMSYIQLFPGAERAESVGQHCSADVACLAQDAQMLCDGLMVTMGQHQEADTASSSDDKVVSLVTEMSNRLPKSVDIEMTETLMGSAVVRPLCVTLLQELTYFNTLIHYINRRLQELTKAIGGYVIMSEELEEMFNFLLEGKVPPSWTKTRPSVKSLGSWCRELGQRGKHLADWAASPRGPPVLCWLPAFNNPTGFLTAVMQTTARQEEWPIDTLCWEFTVLESDDTNLVRPPADGGVYIRSLYLEGGSWDNRNMHLTEPQAMQLICPMAPIHFKPVQVGGRKMKNRYVCPTYYYPLRKGAFVVGVELPSGDEDAAFWTKRGAALLCTLAN